MSDTGAHLISFLSNFTHLSSSFYKCLVPLWMRQIPYTMMKFACFERTVEMLYKYVVPKPRSECSKSEQLVVTFVAGYIGKSKNECVIGLMLKHLFYQEFLSTLINGAIDH